MSDTTMNLEQVRDAIDKLRWDKIRSWRTVDDADLVAWRNAISTHLQGQQSLAKPASQDLQPRLMTVADIPDEELLRRAVRNARATRWKPKWVAVMDMFALGSTYAHQLCKRFGVDPDAKKTRA